MARKIGFLIASILIAGPAYAGPATCSDALARVAARYPAAPTALVEAMMYAESGGYPWIANVDGVPHKFPNMEEAATFLKNAMKSAQKNVDVGCMQVNMLYHGKYFATMEDALDPENNIAYATRYHLRMRAKGANWTEATAFYHNQLNRKAQETYVCRILAKYNALNKSALTSPFC